MKYKKKASEKLNISGIIVVITAVVAIGTSVATEIIGKAYGNDATAYILCDRAFYISLTLLLVEILFDIHQVKRVINSLEAKLNQNETVLFPPDESNRVEYYITDILSDRRAYKIKIICYGVGKYGKVIDKLKSDFQKIYAEIIVCSSDMIILGRRYDRALLKSVTKEISKNSNVTVYVSKTPPTIRASLITTRNGVPLFCTMQPYLICPEEDSALFRGENRTPAIVAQSENSPIIQPLTDIFEKEFDRLKESSVEYVCSAEE